MKKLKLSKKTIQKLNYNDLEHIQGGYFTDGCPTGGCTDGCGILQTMGMCTRGGCTDDCDNGSPSYVACPTLAGC